jgi:hypothetical protein
MQDKLLSAVFLGLCAASQAFITHGDTALFFGVIFFALGTYEFVVGEIQQRKKG